MFFLAQKNNTTHARINENKNLENKADLRADGEALCDLVNDYREANGLSRVPFSETLMAVGEQHLGIRLPSFLKYRITTTKNTHTHTHTYNT